MTVLAAIGCSGARSVRPIDLDPAALVLCWCWWLVRHMPMITERGGELADPLFPPVGVDR